jgi:uncharacterized protein (TIGR04255 family)
MGYRNPTLTEIYAELRLEVGTLPEKSFMALANELAARGLDDQEFGHTAIAASQDKEQEREAKIVPRIRCWDRERIRLVQFSPDALYVNLVGEYPGWDTFCEHLRTTRAAITNALKCPLQFTQVDLVTIDKWKVDRVGFTIGQYLNCGGLFIPEWYSEIGVSSDISLRQGFHLKDGFNKRVNVIVRTSDNDVQFQVVASFGETGWQGDFDALMDRLHSESLQCFEALITDRVRNEIMGGQQ